jgi:glutathione S-transferase
VDHDNGDYAVFESGAILMYLAEKSGQLYPQEFNKRHEVNQWLFFQNAGVGPMQGQANHFVAYATEKVPYGINRYSNETRRLYGVLEARLKDHEWLAAGEYTIAGEPLPATLPIFHDRGPSTSFCVTPVEYVH